MCVTKRERELKWVVGTSITVCRPQSKEKEEEELMIMPLWTILRGIILMTRKYGG
jgi:hypothetical protein